MNKLRLPLILSIFAVQSGYSQLYVDNPTFHLQSGAVLTVQDMNVISNADITGSGTLLMKSSAAQTINMNNGGSASTYHSVPMLEIDAPSGVSLAGNSGVTQGVTFTNGKLTAGAYDLYVDRDATFNSASSAKYIVTNDTGLVHKKIANAATPSAGYEIPVGTAALYMPATLTHTGGTYANAILSVAAKSVKPSEIPTVANHFLNAHWPLEQMGATSGTFTAKGVYPASLVSGTEANIYGYTYNNPGWEMGTAANTVEHSVSAPFTGAKGYLTGYNQTLIVNAKVFLHGSMSGTVMKKVLNTLNLIPTSQPYNIAPWSYTGTETVTSIPANATDWVLLELRDATTPSTIIAKRAGFVMSDGTIRDVDGVSLIAFNNVPGNYHVAIHHRNHLPIRTPAALSLNNNSTLYDFTTAQTQAYQNSTITSNTAMRNNGNGTFSMWGGNGANTTIAAENNIRITGLPVVNDYQVLLSTMAGTVEVPNVYNKADYNMDGKVRITGLPTVNDYSFLLGVIGSSIEKKAHQ